MVTRDEVIWGFRMILGRDPESEAVIESHCKMANSMDLRRSLFHSREFGRQKLFGGFREGQMSLARRIFPDYNRSFSSTTWAFIHIEKTAGTSLQNMLLDAFGKNAVYREHEDTLQWRSAAELSQYAVFSGHFTYDSLALIPRERVNAFSFVAEPASRLVSLYRFWRAHRPSAPGYHKAMEAAARHDIGAFYRLESVRAKHEVTNHMAYCIMGARQWQAWTALLGATPTGQREAVLAPMREAILERMRQFAFVGLREDFERSCDLLFALMQRPRPATKHDHSVQALAAVSRDIRPLEEDIKVPDDFEEAISPLIELDAVIYAAAKDIFEAQVARSNEGIEGAVTAR